MRITNNGSKAILGRLFNSKSVQMIKIYENALPHPFIFVKKEQVSKFILSEVLVVQKRLLRVFNLLNIFSTGPTNFSAVLSEIFGMLNRATSKAPLDEICFSEENAEKPPAGA